VLDAIHLEDPAVGVGPVEDAVVADAHPREAGQVFRQIGQPVVNDLAGILAQPEKPPEDELACGGVPPFQIDSAEGRTKT
jgi:hypothetical protein